ncbi:glutathione-dependent disulfide-bond oxidoreductase [Rheinheimera sp. F8]|uniref:glutathione-dependent disulfide-bond oxidoreductase n=1 Tax=Rheinheimera sp. F8 TaxID=1763998 RepID=UPI000744C3CE|nr:glutathione-dependent disulfide-bond oxidoreductase [Rheinheimera sp. F8]ALZ76672.1 glutathione S-transferase [Rheinheimera sp. F8]
MSQQHYTPPAVWRWDTDNGGAFAAINRPTAGARNETTLPRGEHALQLYSLATPNGIKVTVLLEELLELGIAAADYDAWLIDIRSGAQFGSDFVAINPNSKIPAMFDHSTTPPTRLFESGAILLYLAEKFAVMLGNTVAERTEILNWLFWQMGSAPFVGGGFGHFYVYAPEKFEYPINRYAMETKRQLDVLERQLSQHNYVAGENYSIADIAIWPWYGQLVLGRLYNAAEFLAVHEYPHLMAWAQRLDARPAVQRGVRVNRNWGPEEEQVPERHSSADFIR